MISIIAAIGKNRELGAGGGLCFALRGDMQFFKKTTLGHKVVMGSTTFASLPGGALLGRENFVLTRREADFPGAERLASVDEAIERWGGTDEEVFVIGGASVYAQFLPHADKLYLTEVDATAEADVFFPEFDPSGYTREVLEAHEEVEKNSGQTVRYEFVLYQRKESVMV